MSRRRIVVVIDLGVDLPDSTDSEMIGRELADVMHDDWPGVHVDGEYVSFGYNAQRVQAAWWIE